MAFWNRKKEPAPAPMPARKGNPMRAIMRMFAAGSTDRLTASWGATPISADDIIQRHQRVLVARSREQAANNDYGKKFVRMSRTNIVGPRGVMLQAQSKDADGTLDRAANDAIETAFKEWGKAENCDVTGKQSWRAIQGSCINTAAVDGEYMARKIFGRDAGPWGFALQMLDPQRCPPDFNDPRPPAGGFIRHGIHFNKYGRPLAYYFTTTDEAESDYFHGGRHFVRVPAAEIIHGFLQDIVGQKRGLPWMATALWRLRMLGGFEEAALVNARASAAKMGFLEWDTQSGFGPNTEGDEDEEIIVDGEAGTYQELPPGLKVNAVDWQWPNGDFAPFHKSMLRGVASGLGVAYNNLANDLEGVNFSSIRSGTLDEREYWKELQEWLIESLHEKVFAEWLPRALLSGRIKLANGGTLKAERIEKYRAIAWQPRRWQWVDPKNDMQAAVASKDNLLDSPGHIIREQGRDPETVWREFARDIEAMRAAGIPDEFIMATLVKKAGGNSNAQADQPPPADG